MIENFNKNDWKQVIDVEFYRHNNLPKPVKAEMKKQGFKIEKGLIFVEFLIDKGIKMRFRNLGNKIENINKLFQDLAAEDGIDLNEVAQNLMK